MDRLRLAAAVLLLLTLLHSAQAQEKTPLVLVNPVFAVDPASNSASLALLLRNGSKKQVNLSLSVSDFKSKTTGQLLGSKATITAPKTVPAGGATPVKMDFSNLWESGESEATLFNNGLPVGTLIAQRFTFLFSVSVEGAPNTSIQLAEDSPGILRLKNDDQMTYPLSWELSLPGKSPLTRSVTLPPKTTVSVPVTAPEEWLALGARGLLRDSTQTGVFKVRYNDPASPKSPPSREFPIQVQLKSHSNDLQQFLTYVLVFIMLIAGGVSSLFLNFAVPNNLKRIALKEQLDILTSRISAITKKIDSRLRVALRLERQRLKTLLNSRRGFSPDLVDVFSRLSADIALLGRRVELSEQLDTLRRQFSDTHGLPTSCIDEIDKGLQEAADILRKNYVGQSDLDSAKVLLDKAASGFKPLTNATFASDLATRITAINAALNPKTPLGAVHAALNPPLPRIFAAHDPLYETAANITAGNYANLDNSACRLELWIQFLKEAQPGIPQSPAFPKAQTRLWQYLDTNSWEAFSMARIVLREMQQKIFPEDIIDALSNKQAWIDIDRQVARVSQPVEFCICFNRPDFDHSAASEEFSATWNFGDGLSEVCWTIWHYYQEEKPFTLKTTSLHQIGEPSIIDKTTQKPLELPLEVKVKPERREIGERTRAELVRLAIALFIAVVGLIAGAYQQLAKLDILPGLLAIFLVGFSADTIKNILSPPPVKP